MTLKNCEKGEVGIQIGGEYKTVMRLTRKGITYNGKRMQMATRWTCTFGDMNSSLVKIKSMPVPRNIIGNLV